MALLMDYPKPERKVKVSADVEKFVCDALLDEKQPVSERFRALSIRRIIGSASRNALIEAMRDDSILLAYSAAHELGMMQEYEAIPALENVLCDLSLHRIVRHKAAESLGAFALRPYGVKVDVGIFMNIINKDGAQEVLETCELVLARIEKLKNRSSEPSPLSIEKLREVLLDEGNTIYVRLEALLALRKLVAAEEALSAIIESLAAAKSPILRHGVAYVLSQLENKKATDALSSLLQDPSEHPLVRQEAAKALGSIADDYCVMLLKEFAMDSDPIVSQRCEVSLRRLDYKRVGECYEFMVLDNIPRGRIIRVSAKDEKYLCELLLDKKERIQMRFRALSVFKVGGATARNALVKMMRDDSALLACMAASMLGLIRDEELIPALEFVLGDLCLHPIVRHKAAEALGAFGLERNVPALERSLASDPAPEVRETCEVALGRIAEVKASPLRSPLARFTVSALPAACGSIPILREVLLDGNRSLYERASALFRLANLSGRDGKDNCDEVAEVVIESLGATSSTLLRCSGVAAWDPEPVVVQSCEVALEMLKMARQDTSFWLADQMVTDRWVAGVDAQYRSYMMGRKT